MLHINTISYPRKNITFNINIIGYNYNHHISNYTPYSTLSTRSSAGSCADDSASPSRNIHIEKLTLCARSGEVEGRVAAGQWREHLVQVWCDGVDCGLNESVQEVSVQEE